MSKKEKHMADAERLYVVDQMSPDAVAARLPVCEKTVRLWAAEGGWTDKRAAYLRSRQLFHEELYEFARALMRSMMDDMAAGRKPDQGRLYTVIKLIPNIAKVKDYEAAMKKLEGEVKAKDVGKDIARLLEEQLMGGAPSPSGAEGPPAAGAE